MKRNLAIRADTPLRKACPAYKMALDEFERLSQAGKDDQAAAVWARVLEIQEIFAQGVAFARAEMGVPAQ